MTSVLMKYFSTDDISVDKFDAIDKTSRTIKRHILRFSFEISWIMHINVKVLITSAMFTRFSNPSFYFIK